jgi:hypothetical protein
VPSSSRAKGLEALQLFRNVVNDSPNNTPSTYSLSMGSEIYKDQVQLYGDQVQLYRDQVQLYRDKVQLYTTDKITQLLQSFTVLSRIREEGSKIILTNVQRRLP